VSCKWKITLQEGRLFPFLETVEINVPFEDTQGDPILTPWAAVGLVG